MVQEGIAVASKAGMQGLRQISRDDVEEVEYNSHAILY